VVRSPARWTVTIFCPGSVEQPLVIVLHRRRTTPPYQGTHQLGKRKQHHTTARLLVRRVRRLNNTRVPDGQGELFAAHRYHAVLTDSPLALLDAEAGHRRHAIVEQGFANLEDSAPARLPSGKFTANAAWLTLAAVAHNLTRALGALASTFHARARTGTIRRHLIAVPPASLWADAP
jgi:hypothetical protein